jgi:hypothetical protein
MGDNAAITQLSITQPSINPKSQIGPQSYSQKLAHGVIVGGPFA